ncbi:UNVERIFIED_CONTAM: DNA circularization N-terminal domain-containing protein [Methylobacteriaceae bacterium AG10]|nr:DNA circularization N-terminal domain-containing protein [Methylobacteriaceae bacterium AG10]
MSWRDELQPASFRGVPFHVAANTRGGGRRGFTYEFAKSDRSLDEDLGKRVTRCTVTAYLIGRFYHVDAEALENAITREGGGQLVLPILGAQRMRCEIYNRLERKEEGGFAVIEMTFVASNVAALVPTENTQAGVAAQAQAAGDEVELSAGKDSDWV